MEWVVTGLLVTGGDGWMWILGLAGLGWAGLGCQESKTVPVRHWLGLDERGGTLKRRLNEWHAATCRASKLQNCKL